MSCETSLRLCLYSSRTLFSLSALQVSSLMSAAATIKHERDLFVVKKMKNRTAGVDGAQRIPGCLVENLQLSNKSLRLRYYLDWLQQVT